MPPPSFHVFFFFVLPTLCGKGGQTWRPPGAQIYIYRSPMLTFLLQYCFHMSDLQWEETWLRESMSRVTERWMQDTLACGTVYGLRAMGTEGLGNLCAEESFHGHQKVPPFAIGV